MDLFTIFGILSIICSVLLSFIILIQNSKGGGLSSTFGASNINSMIGSRRAAQDVEKFTWYLGFGLFGIAFLANIFLARNVEEQAQFSNITVTAPGSQGAGTQSAPAVKPSNNPGGGQPTQ